MRVKAIVYDCIEMVALLALAMGIALGAIWCLATVGRLAFGVPVFG